MTLLLLIFSVISLGLSFFGIYGLIFSIFLLIICLVFLKIYYQDGKRRKSVIIAIVITLISIIDSVIFIIFKKYFMDDLLTKSNTTINEIKTASILQDYKTVNAKLQFAYKSNNNKKDYRLKLTKKIYYNDSNINSVPDNLKDIIAISNGKNVYYDLNTEKIEMPSFIKNKDCFVIDQYGNLYIIIENFDQY